MERRTFIKNTALGGLALSVSHLDSIGNRSITGKSIAKRKLGRAPDELSIIGFGGIMLNNNTQQFANETVAMAFDNGINYFDVAPSYGNAQERLGPALKPYRDKCFLACKTTERSKTRAEKELNESLKLLETDHLDLYQLHAITTKEDVESAFGPGGAMEVYLKARQNGKIRYIGFSAHSVEAALLALDKFDFDTLLFPFNFVCWHQGNFGPQVFAKAKERNMGILALKSMALTKLKEGEAKVYPNVWYRPVMDESTLSLSLRYTLSKDLTAAIPPGEAVLFQKALAIARDFTPLNEDENAKLMALARENEPLFKADQG
jgi:predicted aldo/keto reductase-like oxidoreductase